MEYKKFDHILNSFALAEGELNAFFLHAGRSLLSVVGRRGLEAQTMRYRAWLESRDYARPDEMVGMALAQVAGNKGDQAAYDVLLQRDDLGIGDEVVSGFLEGLAEQIQPKVHMQIIEQLVGSLEEPERFKNLVERIKTLSSQ